MPPAEPFLLRDLGLIVVVAALFVASARVVARAPSIVAYLLAGLVLGALPGVVAATEAVELISEVGIALLLFLVGLELSFRKIRDLGRVALLAGLGQVAVSIGGGFGIAVLLGFGPAEAVFVGLALCFSSTVVAVKLLDERRELDSLHGRISIGILLVQDLLVIVVLTFLAGIEGGGSLEALDALRDVAVAFGGMGLLLAGALLASRTVLPRLFGWLSASLEAMYVWSLCWCFLFIVVAEALHLSVEVGAFLAGVSLAQLPYNDELRRRVQPLTHFFLAVFFVTLGMGMEIGDAASYWREAVLLSALVLVGKPAILLLLVPRLGGSRQAALLSGLTLAQISEFSFILVAAAARTGLVGPEVVSLVGLVGLITISVSAYLALHADFLVTAARRRGLLPTPRPGEDAPAVGRNGRENHVIVVGMNAMGRRIAEALARRGERVLAVDVDARKLAAVSADTLLGDVDDPAVLEEAGIDRARLVISALQIEDTNNLLAFRCRERGVPCAIHAFDSSVVRELREIGADHLIVSKNAGLRQIAEELRRAGLIGA